MDYCLFYSTPKFSSLPAGVLRPPITFAVPFDRRPSIVAASASRTSNCQFGALSAPLELTTPAGRFLTGVLLDDRGSFQVAARNELERLAAERDEAAARMQLSVGSDEACLHRRIAEFKEHECRVAVEDVMYTLLLYKFSEMRVHLVPRLSKCVYNGRLEILPSKDWELESIHSFEVLQMVREHITGVVGCRVNANVADSWATTEIQRVSLCKLYSASISYGYFLKSASLRHYLERVLHISNSCLAFGARSRISDVFVIGSMHAAYDHVGSARFSYPGRFSCNLEEEKEHLRFYVMGFDREMIQMCAKPKFKETASLIERHGLALFGDEETGLVETDDVITTSFASLKRFLLEGIAIGSFLWDVENCVNDVYVLEEN